LSSDAHEYDVEAVREEFVGTLVSTSQARYPVEHDPIRRHCHMTGDRNPLYLDPEAAQAGPHGAVIVPPSMLPIYFATGGPWPQRLPETDNGDDPANARPGFTFGVPTPGDRGINMSVEWDYLEPIRVGDRLRAQTRIADVFQKAITLDPAAVWIVVEASIFNQHDDVVARWRNTVLVHRSPQDIENDRD
jgi:acyl dehydratase